MKQAAPSKEVLEADSLKQTQQEEVKQASPSKDDEESASTKQDKPQEEVKVVEEEPGKEKEDVPREPEQEQTVETGADEQKGTKEQIKEAEKEPEKEDQRAERGVQEEEKEQFVLRRKAKSTIEAQVVEQPPLILLTKKTLQEEGQEKEKPIEIEEEMQKIEKQLAEKKKDKGKEKVEEEGQELVPLKADKSALTPSGSQAKEIEEDERSEDEDEVRAHLNTMLKAMQKIDKINDERNEKFNTLYELNIKQQDTNLKQLKYIDDLLMREGLKASLYEAEQERSKELSERLNQAQQRYIRAEKELEESKAELALQWLQNE